MKAQLHIPNLLHHVNKPSKIWEYKGEKNTPNLHLVSNTKGYLQLKTIYRQYFKSLNIQGMCLIGFLDSCLPAQYSTEVTKRSKNLWEKPNTDFRAEVSSFTDVMTNISGIHGEKN